MIAKSAVAILRRTSHCGETARFPPPPFFWRYTTPPCLSHRRVNLFANAQSLACGCKPSKITTLACAVTTATSDHKTREKFLPTARDSESRTVGLAARTRCVKMTSSIGSTLQPWTAVLALWAIIMCVHIDIFLGSMVQTSKTDHFLNWRHFGLH